MLQYLLDISVHNPRVYFENLFQSSLHTEKSQTTSDQIFHYIEPLCKVQLELNVTALCQNLAAFLFVASSVVYS